MESVVESCWKLLVKIFGIVPERYLQSSSESKITEKNITAITKTLKNPSPTEPIFPYNFSHAVYLFQCLKLEQLVAISISDFSTQLKS